MAKKKSPQSETPAGDGTAGVVEQTSEQPEVMPNGAHFGVVQLPRDLAPYPAAQRIVQWVNRDGLLKAYITESAYHRSECKALFDMLFRQSYTASIAKGAASLLPIKSRIHWVRFDPAFLLGDNLKPERINPETDEPEAKP